MKHRRVVPWIRPQQILPVAAIVLLVAAGTVAVYRLLDKEHHRLVQTQIDMTTTIQAEFLAQVFLHRQELVEEIGKSWRDERSPTFISLVQRSRELLEGPDAFAAISVYDTRQPAHSLQVFPDTTLRFLDSSQIKEAEVRKVINELQISPGRHAWTIPLQSLKSPVEAILVSEVGNGMFIISSFQLEEYLHDTFSTISPDGLVLELYHQGYLLMEIGDTESGTSPPSITKPLALGPDSQGFSIRVIATPQFIDETENPINRFVLLAGLLVSIGLGAVVVVMLHGANRIHDIRRKYENLYDRAPVLYHTVDGDLKIVDVNETECRALGYESKELLDQSLQAIVGEESFLLDELRQRAGTGDPFREYMTYYRKDGEQVEVYVQATAERDETGRFWWLMTARDVSEERRTQREQVRSQRRIQFLSEVIENFEDGVLVVGWGGQIVYANPSAARLTESKNKDLQGRPIHELLPAPRAEQMWQEVQRAADRGRPWSDEVLQPTSEGEEPMRLGYRLAGLSEQLDGTKACILLLRNRTSQHQLSRELAESQRRYQTIFDQAPTGVVVLDAQGYIVDANAYYRRNTARTLDWYIGTQRQSIFTHPALINAGIHRRFQDLLDGQQLHLPEVIFPAKGGGESKVLSFKGIPDVNDQGRVEGAFLFIEDITERHRLEKQMQAHTEDLRGEKERLLEASRLKSQFIATISHELRTPLNAIIGFSRIIARKSAEVLDERQIGNLNHIQECGEKLLALINDLLDISKMEAGRMETNYETIPLISFAEEIREHVEPLMERNDNLLSFDIPSDIGTIEADPLRLQQILVNLLGNAAKFTHNGQVTLTMQATRPALPEPTGTLGDEEDDEEAVEPVDVPNQEEWIEISVHDTGIGIPPEQCAEIFNEFTQVDGSATRSYGGTGLGLAISKRLATLLGGDIVVESEVGVGSTFTLRMPRKRPVRVPAGALGK
ncbi:PAS domain S-box protein [bacterium]|nr:PAS domain S-box protein [bacterium]